MDEYLIRIIAKDDATYYRITADSPEEARKDALLEFSGSAIEEEKDTSVLDLEARAVSAFINPKSKLDKMTRSKKYLGGRAEDDLKKGPLSYLKKTFTIPTPKLFLIYISHTEESDNDLYGKFPGETAEEAVENALVEYTMEKLWENHDVEESRERISQKVSEGLSKEGEWYVFPQSITLDDPYDDTWDIGEALAPSTMKIFVKAHPLTEEWEERFASYTNETLIQRGHLDEIDFDTLEELDEYF